MKKLADRITDGKGLKIGVCFMSIFERSGWLEKMDFDYVINSNIENELVLHFIESFQFLVCLMEFLKRLIHVL
jgi:hypothetical protein